MGSGSEARGCLTVLGSSVGLVAGLISIIGFFYPDAESFRAAVDDFWASSVLGGIAPGVGAFLGLVSAQVAAFAQTSGFTPWWTGFVICVLGGVLRYVVEWQLLLDFGLAEFLILLAPPALWLLVFYGTVTWVGIAVLLVAYVALTLLIGLGLEELFE
ncbi:MAG: hypothetical protein JXC32_13700 [Anaerolineae bacterium]|nr:hypothetical protein [Anaerolineae bacterium]